jgi:N-formylglutamate deformylase
MPTETSAGRYFIQTPEGAGIPLVVDSPHSGLEYPSDFSPAAPRSAVLTSCDRFVDQLWGGGPAVGAVLLGALFPRAYVDTNRAETDLDPALIDGDWPDPICPTDYSRRGMGVIRRDALPNVPMYARRLTVAEVRHRLDAYYHPYRRALAGALEAAWRGAGAVWHLNCHSMKSTGNAMNTDRGRARPDFVVSDRRGTTSDPAFTRWAAHALTNLGYRVQLNDPYQGGDLVAASGRPGEGRHSIQIEVNRALYLDEATYEKGPGFAALRRDLAAFLAALAGYVRAASPARADSAQTVASGDPAPSAPPWRS